MYPRKLSLIYKLYIIILIQLTPMVGKVWVFGPQFPTIIGAVYCLLCIVCYSAVVGQHERCVYLYTYTLWFLLEEIWLICNSHNWESRPCVPVLSTNRRPNTTDTFVLFSVIFSESGCVAVPLNCLSSNEFLKCVNQWDI